MPKKSTNRRELRMLPQCGGVLACVAALVLPQLAGGQSAPLFPSTAAQFEAPPANPLSYRAYPLRNLEPAAARQRLLEMLAGAAGLDVVVDGQQNRVLVRGSDQTHELAAQLLANLDRPAPPGNQAGIPEPANASESRIQSYPFNEQTRGTLTDWQQRTAGRQDIRVAIDQRTSQAIVFAPAAIHSQITAHLAQAAPPAGQDTLALPAANGDSTNAATQQPNALAALAAPAGPVTLQLRNLKAEDLHKRLEQLLVRQLPVTVDASGTWVSFPVEALPGVGVSMSLNNQLGEVRIDGPPLQVNAWRSVVEAMDSPPAAQGAVTQLVATKPTSHERVRKALRVLQASTTVNQPVNAADPNSLVAMLFQPQDAAAAPAAQPGAAAQPPADATQSAPTISPGDAQAAIDLAEAAGSLLGPVQVEFVEGLDVIVLRGSERDVQRVMEIINQIEQLSAVTVPAIEVHELTNVGSDSMATLLTQLYRRVLAQRIGEVSITPLVKPNALLLIGRTENVQMAIDLAKRLDVPVPPTGRFEVFSLQNASASEAKVIIDGFIGQTAPQPPPDQLPGALPIAEKMPTLAPRAVVVEDKRTNSLIISAAPRDMTEIAALIARIDTPGVSAALKVFTVENGDAESLAETLRTLFGVAEDQAAAPTGPGLSQGGPVRVQFSVDLRTNSIIAAGSQNDLAVVEAILLRLDEGKLRERVNTVYRLKNAYALDVATALNLLLQTEQNAQDETNIAISPFEQIEREVIIVPEEASNSLVVSATPRYYERIKELIEDLDERPPMVLIQVLIAEVRLNDTDQFGVELGLQDSLLFDRSLLSDVQTLTTTTQDQGAGGAVVTTTQQNIINANGQPGFNFNNPGSPTPLGNNLSTNALANAGNVAAQGLSNFSVGHVDPALGFGGFIFSASSDAVSVLLRALQENRRLEVLSRPQIMALDGQLGFVQVGQDVPTIQGVNLTQFGQTNNIIYRSVGLILRVIPRISPDGLVVLQIEATQSEVGSDADGIPISVSPGGQVLRAPKIEITQAQTTISALSGQTVVLGGLIRSRKSDVHRRVPIIADIPLIGDLFRFDSVQEERRELMIILTPQIIYGKRDADLVKQIESSRMGYCLSDVVNIHGEAGLRSRCDEWCDGETDSLYPTYIPQEGEFLPPTEAYPGQGPAMEMPAGQPMPIPPQQAPPTLNGVPMTSNPTNTAVNQTGYYPNSTRPSATPANYRAPTRLPQTNN